MASLRPALKHGNETFTAPLYGQHLDALPSRLARTFQRQALSGEDISDFVFGFVDGEGNFLNREDALKHAIDTGLLHPNEAGCGTLTSGMLGALAGERPHSPDFVNGSDASKCICRASSSRCRLSAYPLWSACRIPDLPWYV
jgi:hypothetical protein